MAALLETRDMEAFYDGTRVLHGCSFAVENGGITALLGANGAGKTTALRTISGMVKAKGEILLAGTSILGRATEDIARLGVAHVPDGRGTFSNFSVEENLRVASHLSKAATQAAEDFERMYAYFPRLQERRRQQAGTLSGGEQQMLAIARALMTRPRLLLLDEPSFGLAPLVVQEIFRLMRMINKSQSISILLVEQNASLALDLADYAYVIETGRVVLQGASSVIRQDDAIRRSYLGY